MYLELCIRTFHIADISHIANLHHAEIQLCKSEHLCIYNVCVILSSSSS